MESTLEPDSPAGVLPIANPGMLGGKRGGLSTRARIGWWCLCVGLVLLAFPARAALQFDVFLGYGGQPTGTDGAVREAGWFAVGCEVLNDGPSFNAVFEVSNSGMGRSQARRLAIELPSNTRKRFVIPVFTGVGQYTTWEARLLDDRGRVRSQLVNLRPRMVAWESLLLGAVPRTFPGAPKLPPLQGNNAQTTLQPVVARIPVELLPSDPISYEGLDALYLNSEKAVEVKDPQAEALVSWMHGGGHLVLAIEQPSDVSGLPWLRGLLPCLLRNMVNVRATREVHEWLQGGGGQALSETDEPATQVMQSGGQTWPVKYEFGRPDRGLNQAAGGRFASLVADPVFETVEFPVASVALRDGHIDLAVGGVPLVVSAPRGRGHLTVLLFSPEREPFRSWALREWFWARLLRVPPAWYTSGSFNTYGGGSTDGVIGTMIDSRQVRKLPVPWLLLLLVVYLLVIGPFDRYLLRRLNRQMLTWVTFPGYVVLFSLLIYYIGYRLRAGETECNELHIVDVVTWGDEVEMRGRTYASIYSPVNARYRMATDLPHATLRGEFLSSYAGGQEGSRADVVQRGQGYTADVFVPIWTSQLFVSDWLQRDAAPLRATLSPQGPNLRVQLENVLGVPLQDVRLVMQDRVYELGSLKAGESQDLALDSQQGTDLRQFVQQHGQMFEHATQQRQQALVGSQQFWVELTSTNLTALSFLSRLGSSMGYARRYMGPTGLDLSPLANRGDAILLAWVPGHTVVPSFRKFNAVRSSQNTLLRLAVPAAQLGR